MKGFSASDLAEYRRRFPHLFPEGEAALPEAKANKYGAKRTEYNGRVYDSVLEAKCAAELDHYLQCQILTHWEPQVRFDLGPAGEYVADFVVHFPTGLPHTVDAKGMETPVFKLKRRIFEALYGPLTVVKSPKELPMEGREA